MVLGVSMDRPETIVAAPTLDDFKMGLASQDGTVQKHLWEKL